MPIPRTFFNPIYLIIFSNAASILVLYLTPSTVYRSYFPMTLELFIKIMLTVLLGFTIAYIIKKISLKKPMENNLIISSRLRLRFFNIIFLSWLGISIIETIYAGGLPSLILFGIPSPPVSNFGIPLVHGLAQSLFYFLFTLLTFESIYSKKTNWKLWILIIWSLLLFARGTLIVMVLIGFFSVIYSSNKSVKLNLRFFVLLFLIIFLFIWIGDNRSDFQDIGQSSGLSDVFRPLIWFYSYTATPWVNLSLTVDTGSYILVNSMFNTLTGFYPAYYWGGEVGLYIGSLLIGLLSGYLHNDNNLRLVPFKIIFSATSALLFFGTFLLNLGFILCLVLSYILSSVTYIKDTN